MSKFTKGPWGIDREGNKDEDISILNANGLKTVCLVHNHADTASDVQGAINEAWMNANLISACPMMYKSLMKLKKNYWATNREIIGEIISALSKAEGKE